jgi:NADH dehydrogenase
MIPAKSGVRKRVQSSGRPIEGSDIASASASLGQKGRGRIQTDEYLRSEIFPNVYVAGDNLFYIAEGTAPVPQMVENAEHSADTIAHNLVRR